MIDINPHVRELLNAIPDVAVEFYYPSDFSTLPAITYYEVANVEGMRTDGIERSQKSDVQIDIWAKSPKETNEIGIQVNGVMQADKFIRSLAHDLPKDGDVYHRTMRFNKQIYL